ncbi:hypothetical protein NDU88_001002 [Pleurodeles waltl]|uniref:Uncharacterized protein n=1 Tax=Pleurodeles waltl TaxID=8319 RepID=A0AAV7TH20_PLEWA|nr:hypothetical protein NDU88_001002 [Pleurodeles waltl]
MSVYLGVRQVLCCEVAILEVKLREAEVAIPNRFIGLSLLCDLRMKYKDADARLRRHDYRHYMTQQYHAKTVELQTNVHLVEQRIIEAKGQLEAVTADQSIMAKRCATLEDQLKGAINNLGDLENRRAEEGLLAPCLVILGQLMPPHTDP